MREKGSIGGSNVRDFFQRVYVGIGEVELQMSCGYRAEALFSLLVNVAQCEVDERELYGTIYSTRYPPRASVATTNR